MSLYELCNPERKNWLNIYPTSLRFNNGDTSVQQAELRDFEELLINFNTIGAYNINMNISLLRIGNLVVLTWQEVSFNNGGVESTVNSPVGIIPSRLRPKYNTYLTMNTKVSGSAAYISNATMVVKTDGSIKWGRSVNQSTGEPDPFLSGTNIGPASGSVSWALNL